MNKYFLLLILTVSASSQIYGFKKDDLKKLQASIKKGKPSCPKCDLSKINITSDLKDASLANADLEGAILKDAQLYKAHLPGANLKNAQLQQANLEDADLGKSHLQGADLTKANLDFAFFEGADLTGAKGVTKLGLNKSFAHLTNAKMPDGSLYN